MMPPSHNIRPCSALRCGMFRVIACRAAPMRPRRTQVVRKTVVNVACPTDDEFRHGHCRLAGHLFEVTKQQRHLPMSGRHLRMERQEASVPRAKTGWVLNADAIGRTTMDAKSYSRVAAIIFAIIAVLQLVRAFSGWDITLNGATIPLWASWVASVVAGALACVGLIVRA